MAGTVATRIEINASDKASEVIRRVEMGMGRLGSVMSSVGGMFGVGLSLTGLYQLGESSFNAALNTERLVKAYSTIAGSGNGARRELEYLYEQSDKLGLQFKKTAGDAKGLFAAAKGTSLAKDIKEIFEGFSQAGTSLSLSEGEMSGIYLALGQMISKGKVQAEELRGQIGERLPGAFQIAARAMGVTTAELDKMLETGRITADVLLPRMAKLLKEEFTEGASEAQKSVNRLATETDRFLTALSQTQSAVAGMNAITAALKGMTSGMEKYAEQAAIVAEMRSKGITPDSVEFDWKGLLSPTKGITPVYSDSAIQSYLNRKQASTALSGLRQGEAKLLAEAEKARQEALDRAVGSARSASTSFLGETASAKTAKIVQEAQDAIDKLKKAREMDVANASSYTEQITAIEQEKVRKLEQVNKAQTESAKKQSTILASINDEIARMTMSDADYAKYSFGKEYEKAAAELGKASPALAYWVSLKERELRLNELSALQPYQVTEFEALNRGDSFYGRADANRRAQGMLAQKEQEDLQLQTEFAEKHREIVLGETEFKLQQIEAQADAYRRAGADSVAVEQWASEERLRLSRDWADGVTRGLRSIEDEWTNKAKSAETFITGTFESISSAWTLTTDGMKFDWDSAMNSILNSAFHQMVVNPLLGGISGSVGGGGGFLGMLGGLFSFNALGGVYSGPGISAYSGKVVDSPTVFPFAKGIGLMGEAGAEAIMPLTRTSGGELGVQAVGGAAAAPQIEIVINNDSGVRSRVASQQTSFDSGRMITRIVVENIASNTDGMKDVMRDVLGVR